MSRLSSTPEKRAQMQADPSDSKHGTYNGYRMWACRCGQCRAANAEYMKALRQKRLTRPVPRDVHGTLGGTANWGCSCGVCLEAKRDYDHQRKTA